jgi:hypothetical protein
LSTETISAAAEATKNDNSKHEEDNFVDGDEVMLTEVYIAVRTAQGWTMYFSYI